ncbi:hypothetical protein [Clostridium acetireducens]|nr:hypothetical protein [Clostridium acetireducens]
MILSTPVYEIGHPLYSRVFLQLALTCIIAEFSYRFIELPLKKFGFKKYYFEGRSLNLSTIVSFIVIISLNVGIISITKAKLNSQKCEASSPGISKTQISKKNMSRSSKNNDTNSNKQNSVISNKNNKENSPEVTKRYTNILAIGDSIMLDIAPNLNKKYNNITINGKIGRQMWQAISLAPNYTTFNASDKVIIIQLGTNGYFTNKQIDELLESFSKAHIFLVNTRVPCSWESKVNKLLKEKSEERDNVTLIDWYSLSSKNPEYFEPDGVHLNPKGSEALVNLISEKLKQ